MRSQKKKQGFDRLPKRQKQKESMKILEFEKFTKTGNVTYDLLNAIRVCKAEKYDKLVLPKAVYEIDRSYCEQRSLNISNHGLNGPKRIAILIEDMENFEIDFNGGTLYTKGLIMPIVIRNSKNITVKNLVLENPETQFMQARVVATGEDWVEFKPELGFEQFKCKNGLLYTCVGEEYHVPQTTSVEFNGETGEIEYGTGDFPIGFPWEVENEFTKDGHMIVHGAKRIPPIGNVFIHTASRRLGAGIFCEGSSELFFKDVTVHSCLGMGLIAQFCHNVTLDGFSTKRKEGQYYTANADATHFVHCTGLVKVENGVFEGQLDDALNIHGVYVRVENRFAPNELILRQVHFQAQGLPIFEKGDEVQALDPATLLPYAKKRVKNVDVLNDELMRVTFEENVEDIKLGDDLENLTKSADLIFRNNIVRNNRARGMLIAAKGKVLIEKNYYHASGAAILFEADGEYWFESGGTTDVTVRENTFDKCKHSKWGSAVVQFVKRKETREGEYYHEKVVVADNKFIMYEIAPLAVTFDNIRDVTFTGNEVETQTEAIVDIKHCEKTLLQENGFTYTK
jgi:hypothetical protein